MAHENKEVPVCDTRRIFCRLVTPGAALIGGANADAGQFIGADIGVARRVAGTRPPL